MQPDNPYAASEPEKPLSQRRWRPQSAERHFQIRLDWIDRRYLLRSIGLVRVAIVLDAVYWSKNLLRYVPFMIGALRGDYGPFSSPVEPLLDLLWFAVHPLALWICWLSWKNADLLRQFAGGTVASMSDWSQMVYRLARLGVLSAGLYFAADVGELVNTVLGALR